MPNASGFQPTQRRDKNKRSSLPTSAAPPPKNPRSIYHHVPRATNIAESKQTSTDPSPVVVMQPEVFAPQSSTHPFQAGPTPFPSQVLTRLGQPQHEQPYAHQSHHISNVPLQQQNSRQQLHASKQPITHASRQQQSRQYVPNQQRETSSTKEEQGYVAHSQTLDKQPRSSEWVPHGSFRQALELVDSQLSNQARHLLKKLFYLIDRKPAVAAAFVTECNDIYTNTYRGARHPPSTLPTEQQMQPQIIPRQSSGVSPTTPRYRPAPQQEQPQIIPRQPPGGMPRNPRYHPENHVGHASASIQSSPYPGLTETRVNACEDISPFTLQNSMRHAVPVPDDPPPFVPKEPVPVIDNRFYGDRAWHLKMSAARRYHFDQNRGRPKNKFSSDGSKYLIWEERNGMVGLDVSVCRPLVGLQDSGGELSDVHIDILRFAWMCMVADVCAGAVLNLGVGFPRTHLVLTFCHLALTQKSEGKKIKTILVVCPAAVLEQWRQGGTACGLPNIKFLKEDGCEKEVLTWRQEGGVLVCSFELFENIISMDTSPMREQVFSALSRPGPDMVILDEAAKLSTYSDDMCRILKRVKTKSRLALTSLPLGGNVIKMWSVISWVAPNLFGGQEEFWQVFVWNLVSNSRIAESIARYLVMIVREVTFTLHADIRLQTLKKKGRELLEETIFMTLTDQHQVIYDTLAAMLKKMNPEATKYIAAMLMMTAATSPQALLSTLSDGLKDLGDVVRSEGMEKKLGPWKRGFYDLKKKIEPLLEFAAKNVKVEVAITLCQDWVKNKKRPAIFVTIPEIEIEMKKRLQVVFPENLHCYDVSVKSRGDLDKFNTSKDGAVLLARYGPVLDCMEDSGWGFVNATHVLVMDTSWNPSHLSQVVNRVHHFGASGIAKVYHMVAVGTIEMNLHSQLAQAREKPRDQNDRFLLLPLVTPAILEKTTASPPAESDPDRDGELSEQLETVDISTIVTKTPSRYLMSSNMLEANLYPSNECDEHEALKIVIAEKMEYLKSLGDIGFDLENAVIGSENRDQFSAWRRGRFLDETNLLFRPLFLTTDTLLSRWDEYFRLYEQRPLTKVVKVEPPALPGRPPVCGIYHLNAIAAKDKNDIQPFHDSGRHLSSANSRQVYGGRSSQGSNGRATQGNSGRGTQGQGGRDSHWRSRR